MSIRVFSQRTIITPAPLPRSPTNPLGTLYMQCGEQYIPTDSKNRIRKHKEGNKEEI